MNQQAEQPQMNVEMAKVYLSSKSVEMLTRTWEDVMNDMAEAYRGSTLHRWKVVIKSQPFQELRKIQLLDTERTHFMSVLQHPKAGTSTQKWLRIMHNRALDLAWLLTPVMARRFWPKLNTKRAKAITFEQHTRLIEAVKEDEFRRYLQMLWEIGGSQTDTARLRRDNVDIFNRRLTYSRKKLESRGRGSVAIVIGDDLMKLFDELPQQGYLFPTLAKQGDGFALPASVKLRTVSVIPTSFCTVSQARIQRGGSRTSSIFHFMVWIQKLSLLH
jgi:integrase